MALSQQIRQIQAQRITPAMMMEFSLLQLPISELRDVVKKEIESNPALEIERDFVSAGAARLQKAASDAAEGYLENMADERGETLDAHLMGELRMNGIEGRTLALAQAIVEALDSDGRFTGSFADLVMVLEGRGVKGVTNDELEAARQLVLKTDPLGCGARDLADCYRAQLGRIPAAKRTLAESAVDELAAALAKGGLTTFRPSNLAAFQLLKALDPFPGRLYDRVQTTIVTPDVFVDKAGNVRVDQGDIPELRVSAKYVEMAKDRELNEETRKFAIDRVKRAREFREALIRRKETMVEIAEATIARQPEFLERGAAGLKRLTMSEIAKEAKCTIATVSRAAARKYVKTPRGTVPLRKFFVLVDQEPVEKLREILLGLPRDRHVADREIAELMVKAGYPMARRTVAKYRAKLGF